MDRVGTMSAQLVVCLALAAGCNAGSAPSPDGGILDGALDSADAAPTPRAPDQHPASLLMTDQGGGVIAAPEVWVVVWMGDEAKAADANAFDAAFLSSSAWKALGEYGVTGGSAKGVVVLAEPAPVTLDFDSMPGFISSRVQSGALPAPDSSTVFALIAPAATKVTTQGLVGCEQIGGYHFESEGSPTSVPFALLPQCGPDKPNYETIGVLSHELAEAATNPHPATAPAWSNPFGGEVADFCPSSALLMGTGADGQPHTWGINRLYSNAAAASGNQDPCLPAPPGAYFGVAITPTEIMFTVDPSGANKATVQLEAFSFGDLGGIGWQLFGMPSGVTASKSHGTLQAGEDATVELEAAADAQLPAQLIVFASNGMRSTQWFAGIDAP